MPNDQNPNTRDSTEVLEEISNTLSHPPHDIESSKILRDINDTFNSHLSGLAESLKPSTLIGLFGAEMSSPLIGMIGSKLSAVEEFASTTIKNAFQQESKDDAQVLRDERANDILSQIAENTGDTASEDKPHSKMMEIIKNPGQALSGILAGLTGGIVGKSGTIAATLFKGLGKLSLPVALLFGARDFIKGFRNVEKIAGTTNVIDAIGAGISQLVSSLTFGIISPKKVFKIVKFIEEKFKEIIRAPFTLLQDIIKGEKDVDVMLIDYFSSIVKGFTFGFISKDKIQNAVKSIVNSAIEIFTTPFNIMSSILNNGEDIDKIIINTLNNLVNFFTFGIFSKENIQRGVNYIIEKLNMLIQHPIILLQETMNGLTDYLEMPSFDIIGIADDISNEVTEYIDGIVDSIQDFTQAIQDKIGDKIDKLKDLFTFDIFDNNNEKILGANSLQTETNKNSSPSARKLEQLTMNRKQNKSSSNVGNTANIASVTNNNTYTNNRNTNTDLLGVNVALM